MDLGARKKREVRIRKNVSRPAGVIPFAMIINMVKSETGRRGAAKYWRNHRPLRCRRVTTAEGEGEEVVSPYSSMREESHSGLWGRPVLFLSRVGRQLGYVSTHKKKRTLQCRIESRSEEAGSIIGRRWERGVSGRALEWGFDEIKIVTKSESARRQPRNTRGWGLHSDHKSKTGERGAQFEVRHP